MKLSSREREILYLISMEKTSGEIAESLYLSQETVRTHRKNIMIKLNAINTAGMIRRAFEKGALALPGFS